MNAQPSQPCPPASPGHVEWVSPALITRGTLRFGDAWLFAAANARLAAGRCLVVVALGGSVTMGHSWGNRKADEPGAWRDTSGSYHHPDAPRSHVEGEESEATGWMEAYPRYLKEQLDSLWPCEGHGSRGHDVRNLGQGATPSSVFAERVHEDAAFRGQLEEAHLVVCEFSVNDVQLGVNALPTLEIMLQQLMALPRRPAVLLLGASTMESWASRSEAWHTDGGCWNPRPPSERHPLTAACCRAEEDCHLRSLIHEHAEVASAYGVPVVSAVDALGPMETAQRDSWWYHVYRVDEAVHISHTAHQFVAALLSGFLWQQFWLWKNPPFGLQANLAWGPLPAPSFVDAETLSTYLHDPPVHFDLQKDAVASQGFRFFEDRPGKAGFIAQSVGDRAVYVVPAAQLAGHARVVHAQLMHSYQHNGVAALRVYAVSGAACAGSADEQLGGQTVDTLWTLRQSQPEAVTLHFAEPKAGATVCVELAVVAAEPERAENKVKLLSLSIY
jgi:hypothetical protein